MITIFAALSMLSFFICISVAGLIYYRNSSSKLNRVFALLCLSFGYWSLVEFLFRQAETIERAHFWYSFLVLWPLSVALLVHFVMVYTKNFVAKKRRYLALLVYLPATLLSVTKILFFRKEPVLSPWGWSYETGQYLFATALVYSGALAGIVSLVLLARYHKYLKDKREKKHTAYILVGITFPVSIGIISELLLPYFAIRTPELINISFSFMAVLIGYAVTRHELFSVNTGLAASAIIETMSEGVMVVNREVKTEIVNPMLLSMLGMSRDDLIAKHGSVVLAFLKDVNLIDNVPGKRCAEMQTSLSRSDGTVFPALISWSSLYDQQQKIRGTAFVIRDITERESARESLQRAHEELEHRVKERTLELTEANQKLLFENQERVRAERHLKAEQDRLSITLKSIKDGVISVNKDNKIMLFNDSAAEMTGVDTDQARGCDLFDIYEVYEMVNGEKVCHDPGADCDRADHLFKTYELHSKRDAKVRTIAETCTPIIDIHGCYYGSVIVFSDITDRKQIEEELFKSRKLESLSALASGIASEFSTLFSGIITNLFMAKIGLDASSETSQLITVAEKAAFNASGLINQLLTFARSSSPEKERISIREFIENSVGYYMNGLSSDYKLHFSDELYDVEIDRGQMDQVLNNIIINADQAMPEEGAIAISVSNYDQKNPLLEGIRSGPWVRITISDSGQGISSDILTRIFDPYFTTRENNIGLGLTMAYSTVRNHGGQITIDSEPGNGTSFHIFLPGIADLENEQECEQENSEEF